jgi:hypothetical protein
MSQYAIYVYNIGFSVIFNSEGFDLSIFKIPQNVMFYVSFNYIESLKFQISNINYNDNSIVLRYLYLFRVYQIS